MAMSGIYGDRTGNLRNMNFTSDKRSILLTVCMTAAMMVTNLWPDFHYGYETIGSTDIASYRLIAVSAPNVPGEPVAYQHAQRFFLPWTLGVLAKIYGMPLDVLFRLVAFGLWSGIVLIFLRILHALRLSTQWKALFLALLIFQPYFGRYYLAVPFMVTDLLSVFGFSIVVYGAVRNEIAMAALGLVVSALGRQTALPVMLALWVWLAWRYASVKTGPTDVLKVMAASLAVIGIYWLGGLFAQATGAFNENADAVTGLARWIASDAHSKAAVLAEFFLRIFVSEAMGFVLLAALLFSAPRTMTNEFRITGLLVLSVWAQPVLAGPVIAYNNFTRLCAFGYVGILTLSALLARDLRKELPRRATAAVLACMLVASFHHRWSWPGVTFLRAPERFAAMSMLTALVAGITIYYGLLRRESQIPGRR